MLYKFVIACLLVFLPATLDAKTIKLGLGLASVEEGDDRHRPAVLAHMDLFENWFGRLYYYGREKGPVTERTAIVSVNYKLDVFRQFQMHFMQANIGLSAMNEQTEIHFSGDSENSTTENAGNFGFVFGALANIPIPDPLFMTFNWESHVFLAGQAGIFLANGRKQAFSLITGIGF